MARWRVDLNMSSVEGGGGGLVHYCSLAHIGVHYLLVQRANWSPRLCILSVTRSQESSVGGVLKYQRPRDGRCVNPPAVCVLYLQSLHRILPQNREALSVRRGVLNHLCVQSQDRVSTPNLITEGGGEY